MARGTVTVLDSGTAVYERPTWTEKSDALAVLKGTEDRRLRDRRYAVVGFTDLTAAAPRKTIYDPASDDTFPRA